MRIPKIICLSQMFVMGVLVSVAEVTAFPAACILSDQDNDGIPDDDDECPDTPDGEIVDDVGCSCSQKLPASVHLGPFINSANGHEYYWLCESVWTAAEDTAVALGGHLVTIGDAEENQWVRDNFALADRRWIGFTDKFTEGDWVWISGEPVTFTHWLPGEPTGGAEDYAEMGSLANEGWNDVSNNGWGILHHGIVEVDPKPDGDGDGDGIPNDSDNCPDHPNPDQDDCDQDGIGDVCAIALGLSEDCNDDGIPDECELPSPDLNQDGVVDAADLAILLGAWGPVK